MSALGMRRLLLQAKIPEASQGPTSRIVSSWLCRLFSARSFRSTGVFSLPGSLATELQQVLGSAGGHQLSEAMHVPSHRKRGVVCRPPASQTHPSSSAATLCWTWPQGDFFPGTWEGGTRPRRLNCSLCLVIASSHSPLRWEQAASHAFKATASQSE